MTYNEAKNVLAENTKLVGTVGNFNFPYLIDRILIMPSELTNEIKNCIVKWVVVEDTPFDVAFKACSIDVNDDFEVYLYSKEKGSNPISISSYKI